MVFIIGIVWSYMSFKEKRGKKGNLIKNTIITLIKLSKVVKVISVFFLIITVFPCSFWGKVGKSYEVKSEILDLV